MKSVESKFPWFQSLNDTWARNKQRLSHSYLFASFIDFNLEIFAFDKAKELFCKEQKLGHCDKCLACRMVDEFNHPDFYYIKKEESSKQINVEAIRALTASLLQKPHQGGYRVIIIEQAHLMNQAAANSLLKTLEEPNGNTVFFLTSSEPALLMPTIKSRTKTITLYLTDDIKQTIRNYLAQELPKSKTILNIDEACEINNYQPFITLEYLQAIYNKKIITFDEWKEDLLKIFMQQKSATEIIDSWKKKNYIDIVIKYFNYWYYKTTKDAILYKKQHPNLLEPNQNNWVCFFQELVYFQTTKASNAKEDLSLLKVVFAWLNLFKKKEV